MTRLIAAAAVAAAIVVPAGEASAKVVKLEIVKTESPAFEGRVFGSVGTYDRILARATIAVAPGDAHNSVIVDVDKAPRNAQGLVKAVTEVEILRPTNAAKGNRRLFYEALNRGGKLGFALFNDDNPVVNDLVKAGDAGNGFLMNRGYTVVWNGWQGDIVPGGGRLTFSPPTVPGVTGLAREEFIFDHTTNPCKRAPQLSRRRSRSVACETHRARARGRRADRTGRSVIQVRRRGQGLDLASCEL